MTNIWSKTDKNVKTNVIKKFNKLFLKCKIEKNWQKFWQYYKSEYIITEDIPTCVFKKSVAVKVEKICLKCGGILVKKVPQLILIGGTTLYAISV